MGTQDDINSLTDQINAEQQSAAILESDIAKEQQNSMQKINGWQEQARRHHDTATRLQQSLEDKQKQLLREQQEAAAAAQHEKDKTKQVTETVVRHLF